MHRFRMWRIRVGCQFHEQPDVRSGGGGYRRNGMGFQENSDARSHDERGPASSAGSRRGWRKGWGGCGDAVTGVGRHDGAVVGLRDTFVVARKFRNMNTGCT